MGRAIATAAAEAGDILIDPSNYQRLVDLQDAESLVSVKHNPGEIATFDEATEKSLIEQKFAEPYKAAKADDKPAA